MGAVLISALIVTGFLAAAFLIRLKWNYYAGTPLGLGLASLRKENLFSPCGRQMKNL